MSLRCRSHLSQMAACLFWRLTLWSTPPCAMTFPGHPLPGQPTGNVVQLGHHPRGWAAGHCWVCLEVPQPRALFAACRVDPLWLFRLGVLESCGAQFYCSISHEQPQGSCLPPWAWHLELSASSNQLGGSSFICMALCSPYDWHRPRRTSLRISFQSEKEMQRIWSNIHYFSPSHHQNLRLFPQDSADAIAFSQVTILLLSSFRGNQNLGHLYLWFVNLKCFTYWTRFLFVK